MKKIILPFITIAILFSCEKAENGKGDSGNPSTPNTCSVSGVAQKGQLAKGSQVTAFAIDNALVATGESFPANISDDKGSYAVAGKTEAPFLELRVDGYYFNELTGKTSANPLYLEAFVKSSEQKANLNLMTTSIKLRIKNLIKGGKTILDAQSQAQGELLSAYGFGNKAGNFVDMDITGTSDSDAILLAYACMMQCGRSASEVSTLVQEIASDLENDGAIGTANVSKLTDKKKDIDAFSVIENIAAYYKDKSITDASIPPFYKYLNEDLDKDFVFYDDVCGTTVITIGVTPGDTKTSISTSAGNDNWQAINGSIRILSTKEFTVESDSDWLTVSKESIFGPAYKANYEGKENEGTTERTATLTFKDKSGNVLGTKSFTQSVHVTRLHLRFPQSSTKASLDQSAIKVGDKVSVNGVIKEVESIEGDYAQVTVTPAAQYSVCWPTENMGYNENCSYVVKTFPTEVNPNVKTQYYGGRRDLDGNILSGDIAVEMKVCTSIIALNTSNYPTAAYAVIKGNAADDCLSGTVTYVWDLSDLMYYSTLVEYYSFENKSQSVKVKELDNSGTNYVQLLPQTLESGITITLYTSNGTELTNKTTSNSIELKRGYIFSLNLK